MMRLLRPFAVVVPLVCLCISACGSSTSSNSDDESTCDSIQAEARDPVSRAIDANKSCTATADCVEVSFATSCFDSCSRGIAKTGTAAVDAAKTDAENACARFKAKGCKSTIPPCEPPTLACVDGKCQT